MTRLLAIDASTEACSVAIRYDGNLYSLYEVVPRRHTELILPMVDKALSEAGLVLSQLDALAFNCGPGSFTGVRVGTSVVQGLAYAVDLPVVAVSGLAGLAQGALRTTGHQQVLAVLDARMKELYWAYYAEQDGIMCLQGSEHVSAVSLINAPQQDTLVTGSGLAPYQEEISAISDKLVTEDNTLLFPHAEDIATIAVYDFEQGRHLVAAEAQPVYLRDKVV